ncbi:MAG: RluA family pseudouridine synthase [Treponema sp.]|nr:RluA family pseudouridine synthase [Candidatus Treponema equifaecale]
MIQIPIIYENDEIFVINKPAGVAVQGGEGIAHPLDEEFSKQVGFKIYLVHRLDKETCGLMVVAKNSKAASRWIDLIASKQVQKEYTAICFGEPVLNGKKVKSGVIKASVQKKTRELPSETHFVVENVFERVVSRASTTAEPVAETLTFSRLHLKLGTGRMHQIRIHLASCKAPICGDDKHGDFKLNKKAKKALKIKNLLLCSSRLTIPENGNNKTFEIPLPDYFNF